MLKKYIKITCLVSLSALLMFSCGNDNDEPEYEETNTSANEQIGTRKDELNW